MVSFAVHLPSSSSATNKTDPTVPDKAYHVRLCQITMSSQSNTIERLLGLARVAERAIDLVRRLAVHDVKIPVAVDVLLEAIQINS